MRDLICSTEGCERPTTVRGMCRTCWTVRWERSRRGVVTLEERFWGKVEKTNSCWYWLAALTRSGYGTFAYQGRPIGAHRLAYQLSVGPIPDGLHLDHLCKQTDCVNPAHLEPVTPRENSGRTEFARRTHCPQGPPYDEANTYRSPNRPTNRQCRICMRERAKQFDKKRDNGWTRQRKSRAARDRAIHPTSSRDAARDQTLRDAR